MNFLNINVIQGETEFQRIFDETFQRVEEYTPKNRQPPLTQPSTYVPNPIGTQDFRGPKPLIIEAYKHRTAIQPAPRNTTEPAKQKKRRTTCKIM